MQPEFGNEENQDLYKINYPFILWMTFDVKKNNDLGCNKCINNNNFSGYNVAYIEPIEKNTANNKY